MKSHTTPLLPPLPLRPPQLCIYTSILYPPGDDIFLYVLLCTIVRTIVLRYGGALLSSGLDGLSFGLYSMRPKVPPTSAVGKRFNGKDTRRRAKGEDQYDRVYELMRAGNME